MEPVLFLFQNQTWRQQKKENYRPSSLMNIDAKTSVTYLQTEFNSISKRSHTTIKSVSSEGCRDDSTYTNH
jgi:hypothetical protein